jgi:glycosyl transferase family 25
MENVDHIYYINLENQKYWEDSINKVIHSLGVGKDKITKINAVKKDNGAYGCALSHILALEDAKQKKYNTIIILEDDFELFNPEDAKNKITKFLSDVKDWDLIMLSCHLIDIENCEIDNVSKVLDCQSTIAYAIKNHFIDKLLKVFYESSEVLSKVKQYEYPCPYCIDVNWKKLQKNSKWYTFYPFLGREYPKYSYVQNKFLDHFTHYKK